MAASFKVFKKPSPNNKICLYLAKRDFVDHISCVDPIDGVLWIDGDYLQGRKVFAQVLCSFRYGREEEEVMGVSFQKDLFLASEQVFPPQKKHQVTKVQERLLKKLGGSAYPFTLNISPHAPSSVVIQTGNDEETKPCGVEYFVKAFIGDSAEDRSHARSTTSLMIRKVQFAPSKQGRQPCSIVRKDFLMSPGEMELEATLDKQLYHHGEKITINVCIRNHSNKEVKKIKASIQQCVDITIFTTGQYRTTVSSLESEEGCPLQPGSTLTRTIQLCPNFAMNNGKPGIALDGRLRHQAPSLASSTLLADSEQNKDNFGIIVSYTAKVKLYFGALGGELVAELPFILMHPKEQLRPPFARDDSTAQTEFVRQDTMAEDSPQNDGDKVNRSFEKLALRQ
ncbi:unnamed protein product [Cyprideis torosa]|uniref:Uncharacterized protein n=1 Tax=Cyprideis torosa TaxID=163714 RepID=A0A7R8WFL4_9CRUS|nr:unnamed protein product [Cyprideis torosa]CAG0890732.1 unnamed protein product [Cyprideis torosa]